LKLDWKKIQEEQQLLNFCRQIGLTYRYHLPHCMHCIIACIAV